MSVDFNGHIVRLTNRESRSHAAVTNGEPPWSARDVSGHVGRQMTSDSLVIRAATGTERLGLEALQWCAALMLDEYREALLTHPDAVELPVEHITQGRTLVAERNSVL